MTTFHSSLLRAYLPSTRTHVEFGESGSYTTDDPDVIDALRALPDVTEEKTRDDLMERARALDIKGRSRMGRDDLEQAVADAEGTKPETGAEA